MSKRTGQLSRLDALQNRLCARTTRYVKTPPRLMSLPEPHFIGNIAKGRQLMAGNFLFAGSLITAPAESFWSLNAPSEKYETSIQGFSWLDDLAALGDKSARLQAQMWLISWIEKYGRGHGPGWTAELTGRRLTRWISHALTILRELDKPQQDLFFRSMLHQTQFLKKRAASAPRGLARFEALTGWLYGILSLEGLQSNLPSALKALNAECDISIDAEGGINTRNPEELLDVFMLLSWLPALLTERGLEVPEPLQNAIKRIAPTLRSLRHSDGALARYHGGGRGTDGWLNSALAISGVKTRPGDALAMGFARLSAGRSSVVIDAAAPPLGAHSTVAHASSLAFELTSGRSAIIVNCGSGADFGNEWRKAGRATPSHSTLSINGLSSARLDPKSGANGSEQLVTGPKTMPYEFKRVSNGRYFQGSHDGYVAPCGLTHVRKMMLAMDGKEIRGEELILAINRADKAQFERARAESQREGNAGIPFALRFHLHPDVDPSVDLGGNAVSLVLKNGETWIWRHDGQYELAVAPSIYFESGRINPRQAQQIVLSGQFLEERSRIRWTLSKTAETGRGLLGRP